MKKTTLAVLWVLAASGLGLSCANAQVKWEEDSGRPLSRIEGHMFWNELTQSVDDFFGKAVGAFLAQSPDIAHPVPMRKWALLATQFLHGTGERGSWIRGTVLDGQWRLYALSTSSGIPTAFVTQANDTRVVAAAMTASEDGRLPLADVDNAAAIRARVLNEQCGPFDAKCRRANVTIFFKDKFDFNPQIRDVLTQVVSQALMRDCKQLRADVNSAYLAEYGTPPPKCQMKVDIEFVNQLPHE
jgi:hypothetical protein